MVTNRIFSSDEKIRFFSSPSLWKCNCSTGAVSYHNPEVGYGTIICLCGHELTRYEYEEFLTKWRSFQMTQEHDWDHVDLATKHEYSHTDTPVSGNKYDSGKPRMELLLDFNRSLTQIAKLCTVGAKKYCDHGWIDVPDGENRYTAALLRHLFTEEEMDDETGVSHAVSVAWNALTRLELKLRREEYEISIDPEAPWAHKYSKIDLPEGKVDSLSKIMLQKGIDLSSAIGVYNGDQEELSDQFKDTVESCCKSAMDAVNSITK